MKKYRKYMDGIKASDTLHQRLLDLEGSQKRPAAWKKYGAAAAALVLLAGVGGFAAWAAHINGLNSPIPFYPTGFQQAETANEPEPDIAAVKPGEVTEPGEKTLGGYEVMKGGMTAYYPLPAIDYGAENNALEQKIAMDRAIQEGVTERDLSADEIAALLGGAEAVSTHLDWDAYQLTGRVWERPDGSLLLCFLYGYSGPLDHFEFSMMDGQLPPTCIVYPGSVTQEIRGLTVTADKYDGEHGCDRRVSFMKDDYGYRFDLTSTDAEQAELLVSRLVCRMADKGLALDNLKGTEMCGLPPAPRASVGVGEPNYEDVPPTQEVVPAQEGNTSAYDPASSTGETYTCPDCGQAFLVDTMRVHVHSFAGGGDPPSTEPYGPSKTAGPNYNTPLSKGETYACPICGETLLAGVEHFHELCGYPLASSETSAPTTTEKPPHRPRQRNLRTDHGRLTRNKDQDSPA